MRCVVALLEGARLRDAGHQYDRKHDNVFFAKTKEVSRSRHRAFQQTTITQKMAFTRSFNFEPIMLDDGFAGQPIRLIWQGRLESWETAS